ncbi:MAG: HNH endonuclease [Actinomycetia bacterium]|nr:HNH endonuclease [Actinomycetes bacterium]
MTTTTNRTADHEAPFSQELPGDGQATWEDPTLYDGVPQNLDTMPPGPVLGAFLSSIDVARVSPHDQVVVLRANDRMRSHYSAQRFRDIAAVHRSYASDDGCTYMEAGMASSSEIRLALRLTRSGADNELAFALALEHRLPRLFDMLATGTIDLRRARTIERSTVHLSDTTAQAVLDEIADDAPNLTTGQLGARIRKLCIEVDPDEAKDRYDTAHADRRIVVQPTESGTVNLMGYDLPPDEVAAIMGKVNRDAIDLHGSEGETRTMDQIRADICLDLLRGTRSRTNDESPNTGVIDLVVDLDTLAGLADQPGSLGGYGPVIADVARKIADKSRDAQWRISTVNEFGEPVHIGTTSRRPTESQRRRTQTRNRTCVFPGCRMPSTICDIDHTKAVQDGGDTCDCNLAPLCRHDHCLKHAQGWAYERLPDGRHQWRTPFGHTYTTIPNRAPP